MVNRNLISVINGVAKKAALGAMLFSSVAMFATNPIKTARTENPPQTEVVSKDGADALKAMTFPQQQNPAVPTVHNKALDEKFLKLARDDEERKLMEDFLLNVYNNCGSYLASAKIQQELDLNMFYEFLDGNIEILKRFDEEAYNKIDRDAMQKVVEKGEPIKKWLDENYLAVYNQPFGQFDHMPDYEELNDALDDYIEKDPNKLFKDGLGTYRFEAKNCADFLKKSNIDIVQKKANVTAAKTHMANEILFKNLLKSVGLCISYNDIGVLDNLYAYSRAVAPVRYNQ